MPHENIFLVDVDNTIFCQYGIPGENDTTDYEQIFNEELLEILQRLSLDDRNKIYLFTAFCAYQSGELVSFGGKAHQGFRSEIYSVLTQRGIKLHGLITKGSPYFDHSHDHPLGTFGRELMHVEKTIVAELKLSSDTPDYSSTPASPFLIPGEKKQTINLPHIHMPRRLSAFLMGIPDTPGKPTIPAEPTLHSIATQEVNMIMDAIAEKMHGSCEPQESFTEHVTGAPPNHKEEMLKHLLAKLGLITLSAGSKFTIDSVSTVSCTTSPLAKDTVTSLAVSTFSVIVIDDDQKLHKTVADLQTELLRKLPAKTALPFTLHLIPILAPMQDSSDAKPYFPSSHQALQDGLCEIALKVSPIERPYIPPLVFLLTETLLNAKPSQNRSFTIATTASASPLATPQDSGITEESEKSYTDEFNATLPKNKL